MRTPRRLYLISAALHIYLGTRVRIYPHASALTRRMWANTATSTHPDMRIVGQRAYTTRSEVSFAILLADTQILHS